MFLRICESGACFLNIATICQAVVAVVIIVTVLKSIGGHAPEKWIRLPSRGPRGLTVGSRDGGKILATAIDRELEFANVATIHNSKETRLCPEETIGDPECHECEAENSAHPHAAPLDAAVFKPWSSARGRAAVVSPSWQEIVESPRCKQNAKNMFGTHSTTAGAEVGTTMPPPEDPPWSFRIPGTVGNMEDSSSSSENCSSSSQSMRRIQEDGWNSVSSSSSVGSGDHSLKSVDNDVTAMMQGADDADAATASEEKRWGEARGASVLNMEVVRRRAFAAPRHPLLGSRGYGREDRGETGKGENDFDDKRGRNFRELSSDSRYSTTTDVAMPPPPKRQRTSTSGDGLLVLDVSDTNHIYMSKTKPFLSTPLPLDRSGHLKKTFFQSIQKHEQKQNQPQERNLKQTPNKIHEQNPTQQLNPCKGRISKSWTSFPLEPADDEVAACAAPQRCQKSFRDPLPLRDSKPRTPRAPLRHMVVVSTRPTVAMSTPPRSPWRRRERLSCIMKPKPAIPRQARKSLKRPGNESNSTSFPPSTSVNGNDNASFEDAIFEGNVPPDSHKWSEDLRQSRTIRKGPSHFRASLKSKVHPYLKSKIRERRPLSHNGLKHGSAGMTDSPGFPFGRGPQRVKDVGEGGADRRCTSFPPPNSTLALSNTVDFAATAAAPAAAPDFEFTIQGTMRSTMRIFAAAAAPAASLNCKSEEVRSSQEKMREAHPESALPASAEELIFEDVSAETVIGVGRMQASCTFPGTPMKSKACEHDNFIDDTIRPEPSDKLENPKTAQSVGLPSSTDAVEPTNDQTDVIVVPIAGDAVNACIGYSTSPSPKSTQIPLQLEALPVSLECSANSADGQGNDNSRNSFHPSPSEPSPTIRHDHDSDSSNEALETQEPSTAEALPWSPNPDWYSDSEPTFISPVVSCEESGSHSAPCQIQTFSSHPHAQTTDPLRQCQHSSSASPRDSTVKSSYSNGDFHTDHETQHLASETEAQEKERDGSKLQSLQLLRTSSTTVPTLLMTGVKTATGSTCTSAGARSTCVNKAGGGAGTGTFFFSYCETCRAFPRYRNV